MTYDVVRVGIGIFVYRKGGEILLGRRKNAHGEGMWAFPGGKQELGESLFAGAKRELIEECGPALEVSSWDILCVGDLRGFKGKHFLDIGVSCYYEGGEPVVMEPDKCFEWRWFSMYDLPSNLFPSVEEYIAAWDGGPMYWKDTFGEPQLEPGTLTPSGVKNEGECPRPHEDGETYPCHVCKADV